MKANHHGARFASYIIYFAIFAVIFLLIFIIPYTYSSGIISVKQDAPAFDESIDPIWVTHLTDIHVSEVHPNSETNLKKWCELFHNSIKPIFAIFSGDLADNYGTSEAPTYSFPTEDHWKRYNRSVVESGISPDMVFEVFGNHDIWGIAKWEEDKEFASIYTRTPRDNFFAYSQTKKGLRVVGFVPQEFPTGHGPQAFLPALNSKMVNRLEEVLESTSSPDVRETLVITHFTQELIYPRTAKSSNGNTLNDLLEKHNVIAFVNGHTHPLKPEPVHRSTFMELTGVALRSIDGFHLLTIDNGRLNYQLYTENLENQCVITNPAPQELAMHNFPDTDIPIRLISFSPAIDRVFHVTGDYEGDLVFKRYINDDNTVALYGLPDGTKATFEAGIHTINISGDWEGSVTFAVNCESGPFTEKHKCEIRAETGPVAFSLFLILLVIFNIFMWLPIKIDIIDNQAKFILGISEEGQNWLLLTLAGPVCFGRVLYYNKIWFKIFFTIITLWPICLPIILYRTEGQISMLWVWGYVANNTARFDVFSVLVGGIYYLGICCGIIYFSSIYMLMCKHGWSFFFLIDFLVMFLCFVIALWFLWTYVADIGWKSYWGGSFTFIIFPCIAIIMYLLDFFVLRDKIEAKESESSSSNQEDKKLNENSDL